MNSSLSVLKRCYAFWLMLNSRHLHTTHVMFHDVVVEEHCIYGSRCFGLIIVRAHIVAVGAYYTFCVFIWEGFVHFALHTTARQDLVLPPFCIFDLLLTGGLYSTAFSWVSYGGAVSIGDIVCTHDWHL